jgi:hypothetical protein
MEKLNFLFSFCGRPTAAADAARGIQFLQISPQSCGRNRPEGSAADR